LSVASDPLQSVQWPVDTLSATFSLLAQTSSYATDSGQSALSKKKFVNNTFHLYDE